MRWGKISNFGGRQPNEHTQFSLGLLFLPLMLAIILEIALVAIASSANANPVVKITELEDPNAKFSFSDVAFGVQSDRFVPSSGKLNAGIGNGSIWFRLEFATPSEVAQEEYYVWIRPAILDDIQVYTAIDTLIKNETSFEHYAIGAVHPYSNRKIAHPDYIIPVDGLTPPSLMFIRLQSRTALAVSIEITDADELWRANLTRWMFFGGYLSICGLVFVMNIAFWRWLGNSYYFLYAVYAASLAAMSVWLDGMLFQIAPNSAHTFAFMYGGLLTGMNLMCGFLFAANYVPIKSSFPKTYWFTTGLAVIGGTAYIALALAEQWIVIYAAGLVALPLLFLPFLVSVLRVALRGSMQQKSISSHLHPQT